MATARLKRINAMGLLILVASATGCSTASSTPTQAQLDMSACQAWKDLEAASTERQTPEGTVVNVLFPQWRNDHGLIGSAIKAAEQQKQDALASARHQLDEARRGSLAGNSQAALDQIMEDAVKRLEATLPKVEKIAGAKQQQVLVTSDLGKNSTDQNVQAAFESLRRRIANNTTFRDNFVIVNQDLDTAQSTLKRARAGGEIEFGNVLTGEGNTRLVKYHPDAIYVLGARVFITEDSMNHAMSLRIFLKVEHPRSGQPVLNEELTTVMMFHPYRKEWIKESPARSAQPPLYAKN